MRLALRCDRILWKSTVEPHSGVPGVRTRVSQFFGTWRRHRKGSHSSPTSLESSDYGHSPPSGDDSTSSPSPLDSALVGRKGSTQSSRVASKISAPEAVAAMFRRDINAADAKDLSLRSFSVQRARSGGGAMPLSSEPVPATTTTTTKDDKAAKNGPPRWRLLPFFRGHSKHTATPVDLASTPADSDSTSFDPAPTPEEPTEKSAGSTVREPREGDVLCLGYDSLDDRAMRRLRGRSDHRPVVGSFAIYL